MEVIEGKVVTGIGLWNNTGKKYMMMMGKKDLTWTGMGIPQQLPISVIKMVTLKVNVVHWSAGEVRSLGNNCGR
jgi:hypothetical protein